MTDLGNGGRIVRVMWIIWPRRLLTRRMCPTRIDPRCFRDSQGLTLQVRAPPVLHTSERGRDRRGGMGSAIPELPGDPAGVIHGVTVSTEGATVSRTRLRALCRHGSASMRGGG